MKLMERIVQRTENEKGILAYGVAWLLGVPVTVLVILYLIFGN